MPVSIIVLSILLAVAFIGAGMSKLTGQSAMRDAATHFGIPWERYRLIGVLEVAGAAGVLLGLAVTALGAVAAVALMLLMVAALTNHRRVSD
ncbi:MAG: DoxX family protein, partial [Solirubrobacteraceae bacterium]